MYICGTLKITNNNIYDNVFSRSAWSIGWQSPGGIYLQQETYPNPNPSGPSTIYNNNLFNNFGGGGGGNLSLVLN